MSATHQMDAASNAVWAAVVLSVTRELVTVVAFIVIIVVSYKASINWSTCNQESKARISNAR